MRLDFLIRKSQAYKQVFAGVHADVVLKDLSKYCMADAPTFVPGDPHATSFSEGRRDVYNRIMAQLSLTEAQISKLKENTNE